MQPTYNTEEAIVLIPQLDYEGMQIFSELLSEEEHLYDHEEISLLHFVLDLRLNALIES